MRIVYVTTSLPYGAGEAFIIPEVKELMRRGHDVLVVPRSPRGPVVHADAEPLLRCTLSQSLLSREVRKAAVTELKQNPDRALKILRLLLRSRTPSITLKNLPVYCKGLWLARVAREWRAANIHAHWAAATATVALVASEVSGIPWSFTAHRFDIVDNNLLDIKVRSASFVRFISESGLDMACSSGVNALAAKALVIHMGVIPPALKDSLPERGPSVALCPGNLIPVKGHRYLIEAFAILKARGIDAALWIAGQGELREQLKRQVEELGLGDRVRFLGQLSHADLLGLYEQSKVGAVVLPSIDLGNGEHEGIPVALIEAMGYGVPVVSTATGGISELLRGEAGLLVRAQDALALANAIQRLMNDSGLRRRLSRAGRERVEAEFAQEQVTAELLTHFERAGIVPSNAPDVETACAAVGCLN